MGQLSFVPACDRAGHLGPRPSDRQLSPQAIQLELEKRSPSAACPRTQFALFHHGFSNPNHLPRHSYLLQEVLLTPSSPNPHPKLKVFSFLWSPITVWVHCGYGFFPCYLSTCPPLPLIAGSCSDLFLSLSHSTLGQGSTYGQGSTFRTWFWPLAHWEQNPKPLVNLTK